jgi:uncharacterized protein YjbI with pentapeptide repeats
MNTEHMELVRGQNLEAIKFWREKQPGDRLDLTKASLSGLNLPGVNLSGAILHRADLENTDLSHSDLSYTDLTEANLSTWDPPGTNLSYANLTNADLRGANLFQTNLSYATLNEANLSEANLCHADLSAAKLIGTRIYGISAWDLRVQGAIQKDLIISRYESTPRIGDIEVAQFIHLLLQREKIRNVIQTIGQKAVLILGRFSTERKEVLDAIADRLKEKDLIPIIFDFEKPTERDFTETIKVLAGLSLFVIADITNPKSSPLELQATVPDYSVPFVPILQSGEEPLPMFADLKKYHWVLDIRRYTNKEKLIERLDEEVIRPAIEKHNELIRIKAEKLRIIEIN